MPKNSGSFAVGHAPSYHPLDSRKDVYSDPLIKFIVDEMRKQKLDGTNFEAKAGISRQTLLKWRRGGSPGIANIRAAVNTLGYNLKVEKISAEG
jgi:hypothetical protein